MDCLHRHDTSPQTCRVRRKQTGKPDAKLSADTCGLPMTILRWMARVDIEGSVHADKLRWKHAFLSQVAHVVDGLTSPKGLLPTITGGLGEFEGATGSSTLALRCVDDILCSFRRVDNDLVCAAALLNA
jgi:hypothetical protein